MVLPRFLIFLKYKRIKCIQTIYLLILYAYLEKKENAIFMSHSHDFKLCDII